MFFNMQKIIKMKIEFYIRRIIHCTNKHDRSKNVR